MMEIIRATHEVENRSTLDDELEELSILLVLQFIASFGLILP